jgi:hypothetical protein
MRDGSPAVCIGKTTLDHDVERELADELLCGSIIRLLLYEASQAFLGSGHGFTSLRFDPRSIAVVSEQRKTWP